MGDRHDAACSSQGTHTLGCAERGAGSFPAEETDDAYVLELDLPGLRKDQASVEVLGSELVVQGEVKEKERTGVLRRQTRKAGRFEFRMSLPDDTDTEHIRAELAHGVLTVRVPRAEKAKRHHVQITGGRHAK